jgi:hypothetical protein
VAEKKPFLLRLDPALHDALRRWAADDLRSLNGQIEWALRSALEREGRLPSRADAPPAAPDREGDDRGGG